MRIFDRYMGAHMARGVGLALSVLLPLVAFVLLLEELDEVGKGRYGLKEAFFYVALILPHQLYQLYPLMLLLGGLAGLGTLAHGGELLAMRAAGVSVRRIIWSLMKTGLVMTMVMVLTGEFLVPRSEEVAHHMKQAAIADRITLKTKYGFWARDGANFINIRTVLPGGRLRDIYLYRMNEQHELIRAVHAHKAVYRQGRWVLEGIEATDITPLQATSQILDQAEWGRFLDPALLRVVMIDANILPVWGLNRYIDFLTTNGHDASLYRMILWNKLAAPFTALALLFLSAPFLFGSLRTMGLGQRVFIGVLIGLGVFLIDVALRRLAIVYDLPPPLMAFTPSLLCLLAAGWLFRRV